MTLSKIKEARNKNCNAQGRWLLSFCECSQCMLYTSLQIFKAYTSSSGTSFFFFFLKWSLELVYSASSSRPLSQFQFSGRSLVKIPAIEPVYSLAHLFPFLFSFNSHLPVVGLCLPRRAAPAPEKRGAGRAHGIGGVGRGDRAIIFFIFISLFFV